MERRTLRVKKPVDAFPKCPGCLMEHFLSAEGIHVFCGFCGWDSVQAYADAGGYDGGGSGDTYGSLSYGHAPEQRLLMLA